MLARDLRANISYETSFSFKPDRLKKKSVQREIRLNVSEVLQPPI